MPLPCAQVLRASPTLRVSAEVHRAIHKLQPVYAVKFYLYYSDAWWITKLGHTEGGFEAEGNAISPPLQGRYHDGDVKCNADKTKCHGFLQTNYFWDFSGRTQNYFGRFQGDRNVNSIRPAIAARPRPPRRAARHERVVARRLTCRLPRYLRTRLPTCRSWPTAALRWPTCTPSCSRTTA